MTYTAEEIVSSTPFIILMILIAIFLIPLFIDFKKGLKEAPTIFDSKKGGRGKKRSKHLY